MKRPLMEQGDPRTEDEPLCRPLPLSPGLLALEEAHVPVRLVA
jgi:hypothetical protein